MSFKYISKLPTPEEIKAQLPISEELKKVKAERDAEIAKVFTGESDKFLLIIGPCSADNEDAVCEYIQKIARIQEEVKDKILIIPRIYTNKPRTTGDGYKGMLHQPDPEKKPDLVSGLLAIRKGLGLFANIRPAVLFPQLKEACPLRPDIVGDTSYGS